MRPYRFADIVALVKRLALNLLLGTAYTYYNKEDELII